ncbi:MAG TPA: hypothetical protein VN426_13830 [Syntrophomonadaceae bacterium]|nr:hypothetical protein [Syntrophomonadaceae bacterium]
MKCRHFLRILVMVVLSWGLVAPVALAQAAETKDLQYVFLIAVDGLNSEGYNNNPTSNLRYLANEGAMDDSSTALQADTMEAGMATLLTGTFPDEHQHYTSDDRVEVESILDVLQKHGKSSLVVDGSGGKLRPFARQDKDYVKLDAKSTDSQVFEKAIQQFNNSKPFLTCIYCNDCSEALMSANKKDHYQAMVALDRSLGVFLDNLRNQQLLDKSLIVLTAPRSSSSSNFCPLIISGPGCKTATRVSGTMCIDVAPTISRLIGLGQPFAARGEPVYDGLNLQGSEEYYMLRQWVKDLKNERLDAWKKYFGLEDKLNRTIHQMTAIKEERQNIYDFAGEREKIVTGLINQVRNERLIFSGIVLVLLLGYLVEFRLLKRKFLLFR